MKAILIMFGIFGLIVLGLFVWGWVKAKAHHLRAEYEREMEIQRQMSDWLIEKENNPL